MKTNIVIGHSSKDQGATDKNNGMTEFLYANAVAYNILDIKGLDVKIVYRNTTYRNLPAEINKYDSDLNICLHLNAANKSAEGSEVLSSGSKKSLVFANIIASKMAELFGVNNRGVKIRKKGQRGSNVLVNTKAPTVILEPFFIDNSNDLELDETKVRQYAALICACIDEFEKTT
jgi:N-acetylmuramoyl-L-alanine amidase